VNRRTSATLVDLEERLIDEGVPEEVASNFIDRIEKEIEELLQTLNGENGDEGEGGEG
jgi:hypothetical protein